MKNDGLRGDLCCSVVCSADKRRVSAWCERLPTSYRWRRQDTRLKQDLVRGVAPVPWSTGWGLLGEVVVGLNTVPGKGEPGIHLPNRGNYHKTGNLLTNDLLRQRLIKTKGENA